MAEVKWSDEQRKIINSRSENLLVSAAAGAGKTTVLVERILGLVSDEALDIDIDRLLVVTFTKDAAAQMREKIGERLTEALVKDPDNHRLLRQQMLLHNAQIMTIDSFCNSVVKEFFHDIDIDPAFRIGQQAELKLLESGVLSDFIEECYEEHSQEFIDLVESFCGSRSDDSLEKLILRLKAAAEAQAWPIAWLDTLETEFVAERDGRTGMKDDWSSYLLNYAHGILAEIPARINDAIAMARLNGGPESYVAPLSSDNAVIASLLAVKNYEAMRIAMENRKWDRLPSKKKTEEWDDDVVTRVKNIREEYKDAVKKLYEHYFSKSIEDINAELAASAGPVVTLIRLTREFMLRYSEAKKQKNILEFSDLEHFTLNILAERTPEGRVVLRNAASELHERFREIFIDEYQDSNFVQEQIAEAIAGNTGERPYTFMVGDVKQSIYKFRMAKPELFMKRFTNYRKNPSQGKVITLGRNFRSRPEVLDSTNDVFYLAMQEAIGGVTYDREAALVCGQRELAEAEGRSMLPDPECKTELIIIKDDEDEDTANGAASLRELEARYAAKRVRALVDSGLIIDKGGKHEHKIGYGDIVILLRSLKDWTETYTAAFEEEGIPVFSNTSAGFLASYEITAMLNYLRIIDNPRQDIPLAAVLKSAMCGFTSDELVSVRMFAGAEIAFIDAVRMYGSDGPDAALQEKVRGFLNDFDAIRTMNLSRDIDRIIEAIFDRTGFYLYCAALPGGERRASNLDMLMTYAAQYEAGSYSGLFSFVRYLEQVISSEQDLEEAVNSEVGDSVQIMSIHKSKGLEFPVVVIGGMAKQFNNMDSNQGIIINSDFGIAAPRVDLKLRTISKTLRRSVLQLMMRLDNLGEELRLLYVAMTRAKQKLIMIGAVSDANKKNDRWERAGAGSAAFAVSYIAESKCYMDFVRPAAFRYDNDFELLGARDILNMNGESDAPEDGAGDAENTASAKNILRRQFESIEAPATGTVRELLEFRYRYGYRQTLPVKLSVSDIKRAILEAEEAEGEAGEPAPWVAAGHDGDEEKPARRKSHLHSDDRTGADRGILYHKVMQFIPFDLKGEAAVAQFLDKMTADGLIGAEEREILVPADFEAFLETGLSKRLAAADAHGYVRREQPFVLGRRACDIDASRFEGIEDMIPVQGIIDCMFKEGDSYVILDYKTDKALPGQGHVLADRYRPQLANYAEAVSRILGVEISEKLIYSFTLKEVIHV